MIYIHVGDSVVMYIHLCAVICAHTCMCCMCMCVKDQYAAYVVVFLCLPFCMHVCLCVCVFLENAAKVRIALVKGHGLVMVHSLQSRAEQTLSSMEKWLEAHYLAEMKRYGKVQCGFMYGVVRCMYIGKLM